MIPKLPPQSIEAERAVLGACIISKDALGSAIEILKPDDFYNTNHRLAYETLTDMYMSDKPVDFVTVVEELKNRTKFEGIGGQTFLAELVSRRDADSSVKRNFDCIRQILQ